MQDAAEPAKDSAPDCSFKDGTLYLHGCWITRYLTAPLIEKLQTYEKHASISLILNFSKVQQLDTNAAFFIDEWLTQLRDKNADVSVTGLSSGQEALFQAVTEKLPITQPATPPAPLSILQQLGQKGLAAYTQMRSYISFIGEITLVAWTWIKHPQKVRWLPIENGIDSTGYKAIPIVALLSFLIGVVLCYQMGIQLETYGASIYVVDLLGLSILREFGPLITAIIVAGRTGSAFAAQLGTMKLNQEIDALNTMGLSPAELLVLPKVLALTIALPLLSILAICTGVMGGMFMAKVLFSITYADFLHRFGEVIQVKTLILGMIKTPIFAVLIASVGCFQGFRVSGSAASVGEHTTISVVQSIFLIIVADALFSIAYSKLGI